MYRFFARLSGLERLLESYPAREPPTGTKRAWQTVQIGPVVYRSCVTVHIAPQGLHLQVRPPFRTYSPLFIPWSEISAVDSAILHLRRGLRLTVGRPAIGTITCVGWLAQAIRPYLPAGLLSPS